MHYFRRPKLGASRFTDHPSMRVSRAPVSLDSLAPLLTEDTRLVMDHALLRLLTRLANCGMDACSPPVLHGRPRV